MQGRKGGHVRKSALFLLVVTRTFIVSDHAAAQVRSSADKVRVVYSAIGSSQSPLWIAHEAGLFKKHGLDAEILYVAGGSRAAQVILSGEAPVAMFNGSSVISANLAGRIWLIWPAA
jgi:ABC-type nitrate/sulfonate/bicarbonate transport system substrate-binding protein